MSPRKMTESAARLKAAQNKLRGSRDPRAILSQARALVPVSEMQAFIDWLPAVRRNGRSIEFDHFPGSFKELWRAGPLATMTLQRELAWGSAVFHKHAQALVDFRMVAQRYEASLVQDRHEECFEVLDLMKQKFGFSLWILENRISLLQRVDGLEAQKAYAAEIREARDGNDVIAFLAYHLSRRNEPGTSPGRYIQQIDDVFSSPSWGDSSDFVTYLRHRLGNRAPGVAAQYNDILRFEACAALVDHYETFVKLAAYAAAGDDELLKKAFRPDTFRIAAVLDDERLRRVAFLLSDDEMWLGARHGTGARLEDALVVGDYDAAAALTRTALDEDPADAASWIASARASFSRVAAPALGQDFQSSIIDRLARVIGRADDMDGAAISLLKDALNYRLQSFSPVIEAVVWSEMSASTENSRSMEGLAFVHGRDIRPSDVGRVSGVQAIRAVAARSGGLEARSLALAEQLLRAGIDEQECGRLSNVLVAELPEDVVVEAKIVRALANGEHNRVKELAQSLSSTADLMRSRRAKRYLSGSLLKMECIAELTSLIASSCVADPAVAGMLPVFECAKLLNRARRREQASNLSVPVVLDLFSKRFDDSLDDIRSYSYEDFLLAHGLERPSQLNERTHEFDRDLLVYYLRYVCVPDVMQVSSAFQGTRELEDERKMVLSMLVALDANAAKDYENELREVTRAQLIHKGVRQVERSKIYVDMPSIKRAFEKKHRETFQRHQELSRAGIGRDDGELEAALQAALTGKPLPQQVLEIPKNEANDLLLEIVRWLFGECMGNPEHGLDCYLSMRIRHGTLSGQLRTPLEVERVITQRAANTEQYESNVYWVDKLEHLDDEARAAVDGRLARFSADYDALIGRIAGEMIQIQSVDKPDGLFAISLRSVRFRIWTANLTPEMSFDAFFDTLIELFWESVEQSLSSVRRTIDEVLKPEINVLFADLEIGIGNLARPAATTDLDRAVRTAQTGTLQALDIVNDWFRLSQPIAEPNFPIGDLIDVGLQCVTTIHRDFEPEVVRMVDPLPPFAGALVLFSDIFFIIFDNVRRHSGMDARPKVFIEVRDRGDRLRITARNEVALAARTPEAAERVDAIRQAIIGGAYRSAVRSEGGTGLIKLRKLVGRSEDVARYLNFGFEGEEFLVELELAKREIER